MGRTWLITGVTSGFGHGMTEQLLEKADWVIGGVRNKANVPRYTETFGCENFTVPDTFVIGEKAHSH